MEEDRIEAAAQRIERALARIAAIAEGRAAAAVQDPDQAEPLAVAGNVSQLVVQHEALREAVLAELVRLDAVIGKLEG